MIAPKIIPTRSKKAGAHFGPVCQCVPAHNRWSPETQKQLGYLSKMGFKAEFVEVVPKGFIIEPNGRCITGQHVEELWQNYQQSEEHKKGRAYMAPDPWYIASPAAVSNVKVFVNDIFNAGWKDFIQAALNEWNNPDLESCINIQFVDTPDEANCQVYMYWAEDGRLGEAQWPWGYEIGVEIAINNFYYAQFGPEIYYNTIVHEMGHAMGLTHSGGEDSSFPVGFPDLLVPGTSPEPNPNDVMYTSGHEWKGFSADERKAIKYLWPASGKR